MSALTILDRIADDYEDLHPVEYAVPHSAKKLAEIEDVMGHVRKTVRENAEHQRQGLKDLGIYDPKTEDLIKEGMRKMDERAIYRMQIPEKAINKVMQSRNGKFKNIFGANSTGGNYDKQGRAFTSNRNFGTPVMKTTVYDPYSYEKVPRFEINTKALKDSEKYGYIATEPDDRVSRAYGDYVVNFLPANVRNRTTFSNGDTLRNTQFYPVLIDDTETGIGGTWSADRIKELKREYPHSSIPFEDDAKESNIRTAYDLIKGDNRGKYFEAQYHGPLDLGDVESIDVPAGFKISNNWKNKADKYHFDIVDDNGDILYKWGSRN